MRAEHCTLAATLTMQKAARRLYDTPNLNTAAVIPSDSVSIGPSINGYKLIFLRGAAVA